MGVNCLILSKVKKEDCQHAVNLSVGVSNILIKCEDELIFRKNIKFLSVVQQAC